MANISKAHLSDKDIRNLKAKDKRYKVPSDRQKSFIFSSILAAQKPFSCV